MRPAGAVLETSVGSLDRDRETAGSLATERRDVAKRYQVASLSSLRIAGGRYQSVALTTTGGSPVLATSAPVPATSGAALVMERWGVAKRYQVASLSSPRTAGGRYLSVALTGGH